MTNVYHQLKVQNWGQKLSSDKIRHLGSKFQHNISVGLQKVINAASDVASNKTMVYAYGVAHALGFGKAALLILGGVSKGLKKTCARDTG